MPIAGHHSLLKLFCCLYKHDILLGYGRRQCAEACRNKQNPAETRCLAQPHSDAEQDTASSGSRRSRTAAPPHHCAQQALGVFAQSLTRSPAPKAVLSLRFTGSPSPALKVRYGEDISRMRSETRDNKAWLVAWVSSFIRRSSLCPLHANAEPQRPPER